ncbi:MAG TPA: Gfo/Idh/MocA family oxidoreductase [Pirellulaceae bacterium]|nr:Gfo/Idh/MocA family oxidoreductase [Pirellulaceae bacterium]
MRRDRRRFLEDSMFAAAAAAAMASTPRMIRADEPSGDKGPNSRLHVAVIGVNGRGMSHVGGFLERDDTVVTHVCDADTAVGEKRAAEIAKRQGSRVEHVQDMREIFDNDTIDCVSIATPNHWHSLAAIWAMQAGKHVYVEKPVSHNVSEGRRCVQVARKYGKICQAGTQSRSNPGLREAIAWLHDGGIGELTLARGLCYKPRGSIGPRGTYQPPESVDYSLYLGPAQMEPLTRPKFHYDWHWQWTCGNGDLGNQGIHQVDIARWGLNENALSQSVFSYGGRFGYEDAGETANTQVCLYGYGPKSLVFEVRGLKTDDYRGAKVGVIFEGKDGYMVVPSYSNATAFDKDGKEIKSFSGGSDQNHYDNFVKAVRSGNHEDLNGDILEGHLSSALCHTGNISYRLGEDMTAQAALEAIKAVKSTDDNAATMERFVQHLKDNNVDLAKSKIGVGPVLAMNPEAETFEGNDTANEMLTRDYRAPYVVPKESEI